MATSPLKLQQAYGIGQGLQNLPPFTIVANRAPTTADKAKLGTLWNYTSGNLAYMLTSVTGGSSNWTQLSNAGGAAVFTSLTVNGTSILTGSLTQNGGATLINTDAIPQTINIGTGAAAKTVSIGSTNTTSATTINSGSGNINLTGGQINISTAGQTLGIKQGANAMAGTITLDGVSGSFTQANTRVTNAGSIILLSRVNVNGASGAALTYTIVDNTSFTVTARDATTGLAVNTDASTIAYMIVQLVP